MLEVLAILTLLFVGALVVGVIALLAGLIKFTIKLALLPVVILTALAEPADVRRGLDLGADGYVTKPYSKRVVAEIIRSVLKHA